MIFSENFAEKVNRCFEVLLSKRFKIAAAESCTGGMLSAALTSKAGASEVFDCGFITYSNEAKYQILKVEEELIKNHGAVSSEVAVAMARGALLQSKAQVSVAITGIAGPGGESAQKPIGLVYISCLFTTAEHDVREFRFTKLNRQQIREQTVAVALDYILSRLD